MNKYPHPLRLNSAIRFQGALVRLASIDPTELCNEAKIEHCRATRDLRSCARPVRSVLISCGHASLCEECSQRCDVCPICRTHLPKDENRLLPRLYNECIEAGLISKRCDDRFQDEDDRDCQLVPDVQRLYSLFDVALENNLSSLICHYITDVCMDESAVSSDPVIAFLLDEVVVKDWCKQTFRSILSDLQVIYNLTVQEISGSLDTLLKFSAKLASISNVLEVLESSFKDSRAAKLHDVHYLQENILKSKQHMEIMIWSIRHQFLENVPSRHANSAAWRSVVRQRKSAAVKRAWPDPINCAAESSTHQTSTLFIEDALFNLETGQDLTDNHKEGFQIESLHKEGSSSFYRSKIEGMAGCYPFENLHEAIDILFLRGSSDLVVAKQAIFLYYLFDRHWTMSDEEWKHIIDDFAATFSISRQSLLESFTFYLLDECTGEALQEACRLLPEISGPMIHPKVAEVLLERQNPDAALMVMRWSGRDGAPLVSLGEAITGVRVRVECGLLTEAFMYQRMICMKVKEKKLKDESIRNATDDVWNWSLWVEALVTEIWCLCIRRNMVDHLIEFPWNSDEEKHIHKCLLDFAMEDPSTAYGSLLVVFYLQRYRYIDAYQVDQKLQIVEQNFFAKDSVSEEVLSKTMSARHWRADLVVKGIELLPDALQQKLKAGQLSGEIESPDNKVDIEEKAVNPVQEENILTGFTMPRSSESSFVLGMDDGISSLKRSFPETPPRMGASLNNLKMTFGASSPSTTLFGDAGKGMKPKSSFSKNFNFERNITPVIRTVGSPSPSPLKNFNRSKSKVLWNSQLPSYQANEVSPMRAQNGFISQSQDSGLGINQGTYTSLPQDKYPDVAAKLSHPETADRSRIGPLNDIMDFSWSSEKRLPLESVNANDGMRWRSDEISDDEDYQSPDSYTRVTSHEKHTGGIRKSRFVRR